MKNIDTKSLFPQGLVGIIYDCDGVMIDSADANRHLYNRILEKLSLPSLTPEQEKQAFQSTFHDALRKLTPKSVHHKLEEVCQNTIVYDKDVLPKIRLMPGYGGFIARARKAGLRQAVDTNRTDFGIHKVLDFFQLPNYFEPVISCDVCEPKPSPAGVRKIAQSWQAAPGQMLFVGDSPDDRAAARAGGAVFAGFGGLAGDLEIASWDELAKILWPEPAAAAIK